MATQRRISGQRRTVSAGDLTQKILIQTRALTPATGAGVDASETFTTIKTVWAMMVSNGGQEFFSQTNIKRDATHVFYIRFIKDAFFTVSGRLSAQQWVDYKSRKFKILLVENVEERNEFLTLWCNERGAGSVSVNAA